MSNDHSQTLYGNAVKLALAEGSMVALMREFNRATAEECQKIGISLGLSSVTFWQDDNYVTFGNDHRKDEVVSISRIIQSETLEDQTLLG